MTGEPCDRFVRSRLETITMSAEPRYFIWRHVDPEDVAGFAGFAAGTACATFPAAAAGGAVGLAGKTVLGAPVAGFVSRVSAGSGKQVVGNVRIHASSFGTRLRQKWGTLAFGNAAASTLLRKHMPDLYRKQKGIDALCGGPLPNLHVGSPWNRRLNPLIEVDHIRPRSRGGSDKLANLQLTHRTYNRAKGNLYGPALSRAKKNFCQYKP